MPVTWEFYVKRKRIQIQKWFDFHQITDYSVFLNTLNVGDVIPPEEEEVSSYFVSLKQKPNKVTKSSKSSGMTVDKEGFLVAEQAKIDKKPVRKKRTSRATKKTTTKSR